MAQNYSKVGWKDHVKDGTTGAVLQQGTPVSASNLNKMDVGIELAHQKLEGANRQTQAVSHGLQVLNGDVNAPVSLQMEGRSLVSLLNTELDAAKYYLLVDKKTKLKFSDSLTVQGIAKFPGVNAKAQVITRTANLENKVPGTTAENPHTAKYCYGSVLLTPNSSYWMELEAGDTGRSYSRLASLDGKTVIPTATTPGQMAMLLLSYNIVEEIERNLGRIPRNTLAEKIQWIKDNISTIVANCHAFGVGPSGNKVTFSRYIPGTSSYTTGVSSTGNTISRLTGSAENGVAFNATIDSNGFVHYVAYTDAADATTAATLTVDYPELLIELKAGVTLHAPRVPLYEVTKEHYDAALVTWNEAEVIRRYPAVESVQHIQNPYIIAEGDNLLIPFADWGYHVSLKPTFDDPYTVTVESTGSYQVFATSVPCFPNTKYGFFMEVNQAISGNGSREIRVYDANGNSLAVYYSDNIEFTTPANASYITVRLGSGSNTGISVNKFSKPILSIGSVKPFVSRNPSYLYAEAKLGAIGTTKDLLFEQDGKMMLREAIKKDVVLDISIVASGQDSTGYKVANFYAPGNAAPYPWNDNVEPILIKFDGKKLPRVSNHTYGDAFATGSVGTGDLYVAVSDADSGFVDVYTPTADEWKAYFRGWKAKTFDTNNRPTAWTSLVDGTDAPTQTLAYVSANNAVGYIPYKISYALATPVVSEVKSEGSISVNGQTQIEVGSGVIVREKVSFYKFASAYELGNTTAPVANRTKQRVRKVLAIYKNDVTDNTWYGQVPDDGASYGSNRVKFSYLNFDPSADYSISYIMYDRNQFTTNPIVASATFANNIRTALDDNVKVTEDNKREISIQAIQIYNMLVRMKAGGI